MAAEQQLFPIFEWYRVLRDADIPREAKNVGWVLSTYVNRHGENAHPGEALLAEALAPMTTRSIRTHLARLRAEGFVERYVRGGTAERRDWADMYRLAFPTSGSQFPEVDAGTVGTAASTTADHRKSGARPPETERTDHRKPASAQLRMASTHTYNDSAPSGAAPQASSRGDEDRLGYADPWMRDEDRVGIVTDALADEGWLLGAGEEPAIWSMVDQRRPLPYILNTVRSGKPAA